jgi:hypothetical protein
MAPRLKHKRFFGIDDLGARFGLTLVDMGVMAAEGQLRLSVPVAGLRVEIGEWEDDGEGQSYRIPTGYRMLNGLVDIYAIDGWTILRGGTGVLGSLQAEPGHYISIETGDPDQPGLVVTRDELGVRLEEWRRLEAQEALPEAQDALPEGEAPAKARRGVQATHDWDACWLEFARTVFFDGVPESKGALIRHLQGWFAGQGRKVPDESTLQRRFAAAWKVFAPEAERKSA